MVRGVILDLAGVLYEGDAALPGAAAALDRLRALGLPLRFVTNTSRRTGASLLARLRGLGLDIGDDELFTAVRAARALLTQRGLHPLLLIHPDLESEFADLPADEPTAVLIGDAGETMDYQRLNDAFRVLIEGAPLLAINRNRYFREADGLSLDTGPFVAALEYAADCEAELIGKPAPALFHTAADSMGCTPDEVVMIGDDAEADVNGAIAAGLNAILVQTGKYRDGDEDRLDPGAAIARDLEHAVELIATRLATGTWSCDDGSWT